MSIGPDQCSYRGGSCPEDSETGPYTGEKEYCRKHWGIADVEQARSDDASALLLELRSSANLEQAANGWVLIPVAAYNRVTDLLASLDVNSPAS